MTDTAKKSTSKTEKDAEKTAGTSKSSGKTSGKSSGKSSGKTSGKSSGAETGRAGAQKEAAARSSGTKGKTGSSRSGAKRRAGRASGGNRQPLLESFSHAFDGIMTGVEERNMKIHFGFTILVVLFGLLLKISATEWCLCFVLFGLILGLELVNTAIEAVVDLVTEEYRPLAKRAKDAAAGAVLIAAIMAAITGLIIFIPRFLYVFRII
jgi:diacylglycerol kinase (ATP)